MDLLCSYSEFTSVWYYCHQQESLGFDPKTDMSFNHKKCNLRKSNIQVCVSKCEAMPTPSGVPWNAQDMPWSSNIPHSHIMEFNAQPWNANVSNMPMRSAPCKRKSTIQPSVPTKQHISEEKMAAHFDNLHISLDYPTRPTDDSYAIDSVADNSDSQFSVDDMDFESRLKSAQKIVLCEEMRKLKNDPIVPLALLNSIEKPCKAVVLWQPPSTLRNHIHLTNTLEQADQEQDNNNCTSLDLNNVSMEMEL